MKQMRLLIVTLFAAVLPMELLGNMVIKELNSTFTGNEYGIANETYSEGTLTTSEGNTWTWREGGEAKSPVISMAEVDGWNVLAVKPRTSSFNISTDFSVPGNIQEIFCALGGNIGKVMLDFGEQLFSYNLNIADDGKLHYYAFGYSDLSLSSTNVNQCVQMTFYPKDESSDQPMYIQRINISTEVTVADGNDIISIFGDYEGYDNALPANDGEHNWYISLPADGTELEKYNTLWNDEMCVYLRATGGNSTYPKLTLTSDFPVEGKVKKVIVQVGGDIHHIYYSNPYGASYESVMADSNVPYFDEFVLDFGDGIEVNDHFSFDMYVGRNTFLKSITLVMESGTIEFSGLISTFSEWEPWDVTASFIVGLMKSKEDTPWLAFIHDTSAYVGMTTYLGTPTALPTDGGSSSSEECMVVGDYSKESAVEIELVSQFPIKGHVKKVVVRFAGHLEHLASVCQESETYENAQFAEQMVYEKDGFSDVELLYDGVTEYENAEIRITLNGYEPIFLQSITVVQDEGADTGLPHGKCGDNLEYALTELPYTVWVWDQTLGQSLEKQALKLIITGTGAMDDYDDWDNLAPWRGEYREQIGEIELPDGMTRVGTEAFDACYNAHINGLPSTILSIGSYAFYGMSNWPSEDLHLPDGLAYIEYSAFRFCDGIKNIYLPANLTFIGDAALSGIFSLENIYVDEANTYFKADSHTLIEIAKNKLLAATKDAVIPSYVEEIASNAFYSIPIEDIDIPNGVKIIGSYAFSHSQIHELSIPNSVTDIGYYAFYGCKNLQTVVIGRGLTNMGNDPFYTSNNITDVYCFANPETLTWKSSNYENNAFMADKATKMHVYAADLAKYEENFSFLNVTFVGDLADWEDGIKEINGERTMDDNVYDLSGRKIVNGKWSNGKLPQGIYIRGGKKFMVK